jgi:hypothetical protein
MMPKSASTGLGVVRSKLNRPFRRLKLPVHAAAADVVDSSIRKVAPLGSHPQDNKTGGPTLYL